MGCMPSQVVLCSKLSCWGGYERDPIVPDNDIEVRRLGGPNVPNYFISALSRVFKP